MLDDVQSFGDLIDPNFEQTTNLVIRTSDEDPGFVNIDGNGAEDFALTGSSPAVDAGTAIDGHTVDFVNNPVPGGSAPDVGAFELQ